MSKETIVISLGLWVMMLPYLGIPRTWLTVLMVATGVALLIAGFLLRAEVLSRTGRKVHHHQPFVEHVPHEEHSPSHHEDHAHKERFSSLN